MKPGTLYLIPTPLSSEAELDVSLVPHLIATLPTIGLFLVEREKTARRFLRKAGLGVSFSEENVQVLDKHTAVEEMFPWIQRLLQGENLGILSEAGCPGIADPGSAFVSLVHEHGLAVHPLVGPSSFTLALMASGLTGQSFQFHGYIPVERKQRIQALQHMERLSFQHNQTQLFMETPYRNQSLFRDILENCRDTTFLSISCNLTAPDAFVGTCSVERWKQQSAPNLHKKPAVFCLLSQ